MTKQPLLIEGMHGLGDCIHQRAILRQIMPSREVWLETSWPAVYHDLVGPDLKLLRKHVNLRTQAENAERESAAFERAAPPPGIERMRVSYHGTHVMATESKTVLEGMCAVTGVSYDLADYVIPVPYEWLQRAEKLLNEVGYTPEVAATKPLLVYRPLVARNEWKGSVARNANELAYAHLFSYLRNHYFVISIAHLKPGAEWMVGPKLIADVELHRGELDFETMAALFHEADLVFTSSGFAAILAPAVGTPCISVVGGYEDGRAHDSGARFAPFLSIEPVVPCRCWSSACRQMCTKEIDMIPAVDQIAAFVRDIQGVEILPLRGIASDMYERQTAGHTVTPPLAQPFSHPLYAHQRTNIPGLKA